jgi:hypothetical protein
MQETKVTALPLPYGNRCRVRLDPRWSSQHVRTFSSLIGPTPQFTTPGSGSLRRDGGAANGRMNSANCSSNTCPRENLLRGSIVSFPRGPRRSRNDQQSRKD